MQMRSSNEALVRRQLAAASMCALWLGAGAAYAQGDVSPTVEPEAAATEATPQAPSDEVIASADAPTTPRPGESVPGATTANLAYDGGLGFQRLGVAQGGGAMTFRVGFLGQIFSMSDAIRQGDDNTRVAGTLVVQGTFLDYLSVNLGLGARNNVNSLGQPQAMLSQGDMHLGVRGFYPVHEAVSLGGDLTLYFPTSFGEAGLAGSATSVRPRLIASMDVQKLSQGLVPMQGHFNLGYRVDNSQNTVPEGTVLTRIERFAYDISAYDMVEVGLGGEFELPYVRPFFAYYMGVPVNGPDDACGRAGLDCVADAGFGSFPKLLSVGAKVEPLENLGLHASLDFGLATRQAFGLPATAPYTVNLGLSWTIDPTPKVEYIVEEKIVEKEKLIEKEPPRVYIDGLVIDTISEKPISGARVEYVDTGLTAQSSSTGQGAFRSYGFAPGAEVKMLVSHPEYKPSEVIATVGEQDLKFTVKLEALPRRAFVEGKVVDLNGKPISNARLSLSGEREFSFPVDAAGQFTGEIKPGKFAVIAKADGFLSKSRDMDVRPDERLNLEFVLTPAPKKELAKLGADKIEILDKIFFDKNKATIQPKSFPLLDSVVSIMAENPRITLIQVEGHTDDSGNAASNLELSQSRAEAVRDYLVKQGISSSRIIAKGFGQESPIAPNTSERNRSLNRRVEFNIKEQGAKP